MKKSYYFLFAVCATFLLYLPTIARANVHTTTIYFAGTGIEADWWDWEKSDFEEPELVTTLAKEQDDFLDTQHKLMVAGIGSRPDCGPLIDLIQQADPHKFHCRNWNTTLTEATLFLDDLLDNKLLPDDTMILNIVGFSRGAVATLMLLKRVADSVDPGGRIVKINILAIDPVPGAIVSLDEYNLNSRLSKFVAIYPQDERSHLFNSVVPWYNKGTTDAFMFRVRGSHESLVGNLQVNGHSLVLALPNPSASYGGLQIISNVVAITALELLRSPEWGEVMFPAAFLDEYYSLGMDEANRKTVFHNNIMIMNEVEEDDPWIDYDLMRRTTFTLLLESYRNEWPFGTTCYPADPIIGPLFGIHNAPRCIIRIKLDGNENETSQWGGLEYQGDIPLVGEGVSTDSAWNRLWQLGNTNLDPDDDKDGILDEEDNCALAPNSGQEDNDEDGIGDACDDDDDNDTVPDPDDNCPLMPNTDQADWDDDNIGDACDNCPDNANTDQADRDDDGIGNICDPPSPNDPELGEAIEEMCSIESCANNHAAHVYCDRFVNICYEGVINDQSVDKCWWAGLSICETFEPKLPFVDYDGDGVPNDDDNCPRAPNADQADDDRDGRGDVCDVEIPPQGDPAMGDAVKELCSLDLCADNQPAQGYCVAFMNSCLKGADHQEEVEKCWAAGFLQCTGR